MMKVIGLISGTSADGIDAALVEIKDGGLGVRDWGRGADPHPPTSIPRPLIPGVRLLAFETFPYPTGLRERILQLATPSLLSPPPAGGREGGWELREVCHLNFYLGELFAQAALALAEKAGIGIEEIQAIGSHGQTICHLPDGRDGILPLPVGEGLRPSRIRSTLQLGEPSIIAERTGVTTVADFRPGDIACGGEGAPLSPYFHYVVFRDPHKGRIILNIGGISNLTYIPAGAGAQEVVAFDTGPGNVLIDGLVHRITGGTSDHDEGGRLASKGKVQGDLLASLLKHPFLKRLPPKSTGREEFGPDLLEEILKRGEELRLSPEDLVATVSAFTVEAITCHIKRFLPQGGTQELILSGGGAENLTLVRMLQARLPHLAVLKADEVGFPGRAVEAAAFAFLAYLTLSGKPGNLPSVTGAKREAILGKIVPGRNFRGFPLQHPTSNI